MSSIHFQLITPERTLFNGEVASLICQTQDGQISILPNHTSLVATLSPGELVVRGPQEQQILHVGGGILRVEPNSKVVILADAAEHVSEIDIKMSKEAIEAAKERLKATTLSDREFAAVISKMERNIVRLRIARKHAHRRRSPVTSEGVLEE